MSKAAINHNSKSRSLPKAATGIQGLDEITGGGLLTSNSFFEQH